MGIAQLFQKIFNKLANTQQLNTRSHYSFPNSTTHRQSSKVIAFE